MYIWRGMLLADARISARTSPRHSAISVRSVAISAHDRHLLVKVLPQQEEIMLRCKRVARGPDLELDGTNDRPRLDRRDIGLLENVEGLGLHGHDDKRRPKCSVNE